MNCRIRLRLGFALLLTGVVPSQAQLTLEGCLARAEENYPVIRKYGIIEKISAIELSDINKSWLPQATAYGQVSGQNSVPEFTEALRGVLDQMGQKMRGLGKTQYKIGVDVNQTVWDGGMSHSRREAVRAKQLEQQAALDVEMYGIRERVESVYFGILLIDKQIEQTETTLTLLESNLDQIRAMRRNGVAMQCDVDMIEAEKLSVSQQLASARGNRAAYCSMLEVLTGEPTEGKTLAVPDATMPPEMTSARPELRMFEARMNSNNSQLQSIKTSLMPKVGLFAQAYYGYPGLNYFESMRNRRLSLNIMTGVKVSWNIGALYTRRNDTDRIALANQTVEADRDRFLFDTGMTAARQKADIESMHEVMADDARIVALRANVRKAAESQLRNGVIDATALLTKITDENRAKLTASYHEMELLRLIYQLRNTLNR